MNIYHCLAILLTVVAAISYVNRKYLKLHPTIGVMVGSMIASAVLVLLQISHIPTAKVAVGILDRLGFGDLLLQWMLGFLLFAGAIHSSLKEFLRRKWEIGVFALVGVLGSAFIAAGLMYVVCLVLKIPLQFIHCMLFGALISPTDPIAVLAILKKVGAPKDLETDVCGESLFNDGVGVVMFMTVLTVYTGGTVKPSAVVLEFLVSAAGGFVVGMILGFLGGWLLKAVPDIIVQVMITVAIASGGFTLANVLHCSGAIAMVVAGVLVGHHLDRLGERNSLWLNGFWELIDEYGNAILFTLVGLEVLVVTRAVVFGSGVLLLGALAIPAVLLGRGVSIAAPLKLLSYRFSFCHHAIRILTWGGLRGGLPFAMALSLPYLTREQTAARDYILVMTYFVVAFSIIVQGMTIKGLIRKSLAHEASQAVEKT